MQILRYWERIVSFLFPPTCASCENVLLNEEELICTGCQYHLPINDYHLYLENDAYKRLKLKAPIECAVAYLSFSRSSLVQTMLHKVKHRKAREICDYFGYHFGIQLLSSPYYDSIDLIVPLPIARRGQTLGAYNQNECLARGIGAALHLPVNSSDFICSEIVKSSSRHKVFHCISSSSFVGKHILLVDDLLDSGDVLGAAINSLIDDTGCKVSVAILAIA